MLLPSGAAVDGCGGKEAAVSPWLGPRRGERATMKTDLSQPPALHGIRVIDLTTVVFGPSATQTLADYGADVIKVEGPEGDSTRFTGPALEEGMASLFLGSNRNKRSIVLDLKSEAGRLALSGLIDTADMLVHNIRPQKLAALGLAPDECCARNPRLIYVGLHGFGEDGPYAGLPAYDDIIQSLSGAADLCRRQTGTPRYMPTIVADKVAGQMAVHAALAALYQRERTGRGQFVEVPMYECVVQFLMTEHFAARHLVGPEDEDAQPRPEAFGYRRTLAEWRKPYATTDGHVCFMPYSDRNWRDFFAAVSLTHCIDDPRFATIARRTDHIELLYRMLVEVIAGESSDYWLELGGRLGIPCSRVNAMSDLEADPHLAAVGMFGLLPGEGGSAMRYVRSPIRLAASEVPPRLPPRLGEHSAEILAELDLEPELVRALTGSRADE